MVSMAKHKLYLVTISTFSLLLLCKKRYILLRVTPTHVIIIDAKGFLSDTTCYSREFIDFLKYLCSTRILLVTPPLKLNSDGSLFCAKFQKLFSSGYNLREIMSKLRDHQSFDQISSEILSYIIKS